MTAHQARHSSYFQLKPLQPVLRISHHLIDQPPYRPRRGLAALLPRFHRLRRDAEDFCEDRLADAQRIANLDDASNRNRRQFKLFQGYLAPAEFEGIQYPRLGVRFSWGSSPPREFVPLTSPPPNVGRCSFRQRMHHSNYTLQWCIAFNALKLISPAA